MTHLLHAGIDFLLVLLSADSFLVFPSECFVIAVNSDVLGLAELLLPGIPAWPLCHNRFCYRSMNVCWYGPRCSVICGDSSAWPMFRFYSESCRAELSHCFRFLALVFLILHWHQLVITANDYYKPLLPPPFVSHSVWGTLQCFVIPSVFAVVLSLGLKTSSE